jgi:hypothetical protein
LGPPCGRRWPAASRDVGAASVDLGDALLGLRQIVAKFLDPLRHHRRQLLERVPRLGEPVPVLGQSLAEDAQGLLVLQVALLALPVLAFRHVAARVELGGGTEKILGNAEAILLN